MSTLSTPTPCRRCWLPLEGAAIRIGICVSCVQLSTLETVTIPRPRYSDADGQDDDETSEYDIHPE